MFIEIISFTNYLIKIALRCIGISVYESCDYALYFKALLVHVLI